VAPVFHRRYAVKVLVHVALQNRVRAKTECVALLMTVAETTRNVGRTRDCALQVLTALNRAHVVLEQLLVYDLLVLSQLLLLPLACFIFSGSDGIERMTEFEGFDFVVFEQTKN